MWCKSWIIFLKLHDDDDEDEIALRILLTEKIYIMMLTFRRMRYKGNDKKYYITLPPVYVAPS